MNKLTLSLVIALFLAILWHVKTSAQLPPLDATLYTNEHVFYAKDPTPQPNTEVLRSAILEVINNSTTTLDIALYGLNSQMIVDAIIEARNRGVAVRVVGHGDYTTHASYGYYYSQLGLHVPMVLSDGDGLMHNKIIIADGQTVLTGSTNFTTTGLFYNFNNVMTVNDSRIASAYTCKFNEMFIDRRFGLNASSSCSGVFEFADGVTVEVIFTPNQGEYYVNELPSDLSIADYVVIDAFYLTLDQVGRELQRLLEDGVPVHAIMDENGFNGSGDELKRLCDLNIGLNQKTTNTGGKNHNKTILIQQQDGTKVIWLGSTNFSRSGTTGSTRYGANDENTLRITGADWLFDQYERYFWTVFNELPAFQECRVTNAENNIPACMDTHDNDHDGYVDSIDWDCDEATLSTCTDGLDNDGDSFVDGDDWGCWMIERLCKDKLEWLPIKVNEGLLTLRWSSFEATALYQNDKPEFSEADLIGVTDFGQWVIELPEKTSYFMIKRASDDLGCLDMTPPLPLIIKYPFTVEQFP